MSVESKKNKKEKTFDKKLRNLIDARQPIIWVNTPEEMRCQFEFNRIFEDYKNKYGCNKKQVIWDCTNEKEDWLSFLNKIISYDGENAIFIMRDPQFLLDNPIFVRKMRTIYEHLSCVKNNLIITSPTVPIFPPGLDKEIFVINFDYPTSEELLEMIEKIFRNFAEEYPDLKIKVNNEIMTNIIRSLKGLTFAEIKCALFKIVVSEKEIGEKTSDLLLLEKEQLIKKGGLLQYINFLIDANNDIGGVDVLKDWMRKRKKSFSEEAREFGLPVPRGVLMIGMQGCGKSMIAKAIARIYGMPLVRLDMGALFGSLVGQSEERTRKAIEQVEAISPCVLWIDELDKAASGMQGSSGDSGVSARVLSTILTWLQEKTEPVFVVATANNITNLPPELSRKGRFDEIFFIDLPSFGEREDIFKIHIKKVNRHPKDFNIRQLSSLTQGFSGAEIEAAIVSALYDAFDDSKDLNMDYITKAISETVPLSKTYEKQLNETREWAEGRARKASSTNVERDSSKKLDI